MSTPSPTLLRELGHGIFRAQILEYVYVQHCLLHGKHTKKLNEEKLQRLKLRLSRAHPSLGSLQARWKVLSKTTNKPSLHALLKEANDARNYLAHDVMKDDRIKTELERISKIKEEKSKIDRAIYLLAARNPEDNFEFDSGDGSAPQQ